MHRSITAFGSYAPVCARLSIQHNVALGRRPSPPGALSAASCVDLQLSWPDSRPPRWPVSARAARKLANSTNLPIWTGPTGADAIRTAVWGIPAPFCAFSRFRRLPTFSRRPSVHRRLRNRRTSHRAFCSNFPSILLASTLWSQSFRLDLHFYKPQTTSFYQSISPKHP